MSFQDRLPGLGFRTSLEDLAQAMGLLLLLLLWSEVPAALESSPQGSWIFPDSHFSSCGAAGSLPEPLSGYPTPGGSGGHCIYPLGGRLRAAS